MLLMIAVQMSMAGGKRIGELFMETVSFCRGLGETILRGNSVLTFSDSL